MNEQIGWMDGWLDGWMDKRMLLFFSSIGLLSHQPSSDCFSKNWQETTTSPLKMKLMCFQTADCVPDPPSWVCNLFTDLSKLCELLIKQITSGGTNNLNRFPLSLSSSLLTVACFFRSALCDDHFSHLSLYASQRVKNSLIGLQNIVISAVGESGYCSN